MGVKTESVLSIPGQNTNIKHTVQILCPTFHHLQLRPSDQVSISRGCSQKGYKKSTIYDTSMLGVHTHK